MDPRSNRSEGFCSLRFGDRGGRANRLLSARPSRRTGRRRRHDDDVRVVRAAPRRVPESSGIPPNVGARKRYRRRFSRGLTAAEISLKSLLTRRYTPAAGRNRQRRKRQSLESGKRQHAGPRARGSAVRPARRRRRLGSGARRDARQRRPGNAEPPAAKARRTCQARAAEGLQ